MKIFTKIKKIRLKEEKILKNLIDQLMEQQKLAIKVLKVIT